MFAFWSAVGAWLVIEAILWACAQDEAMPIMPIIFYMGMWIGIITFPAIYLKQTGVSVKWCWFTALVSVGLVYLSFLALCAHQNNDDVANWFNWATFKFNVFVVGGVLGLIAAVMAAL